ncbi:uncharacterized protein CTRU02_208498 [Colletotrichum truncatum]|uniref:Uncharacterized protein n=1 Tax=Colletotrichum truncatum TaxID=5467 RepID=A0ACC3YWH4_COLTU|nr:uncharacterized protein CTRU02_10253 [Colletotrichum truncatum]KAF6787457.1 hypothetical protein CTRU02_10253 [Colletotrichum truncatum]
MSTKEKYACIEALFSSANASQSTLADSIIDLWEKGITPAHIYEPNPVYNTDEELIRTTYHQILDQRDNIYIAKKSCENLHEPIWQHLPISKNKTLKIASTIAQTRYYLSHDPGTPIFSYNPRPSLPPGHPSNFTYCSTVPYPPSHELARLEAVTSTVLAQLSTLLAFDISNPTTLPDGFTNVLNETEFFDPIFVKQLHVLWLQRFPDRSKYPSAFSHAVMSSPAVREFAWLLMRLNSTETPDFQSINKELCPVADMLTFDREPNSSITVAMVGIMKLYLRDEGMKARRLLFEEEQYENVLVYRGDTLFISSLDAHYASYAGQFVSSTALFHPDAIITQGASLEPVQIGEDVLAAARRIQQHLHRDTPTPTTPDQKPSTPQPPPPPPPPPREKLVVPPSKLKRKPKETRPRRIPRKRHRP